MTDLEICQQLAERVHGWKIAPDEGWIEWCKNKANYPHLAGDTYYDSILADPSEWNPFSSWDDAMGLAEAWMDSAAGDWYDLERLPVHGYYMYLFPPETAKDGEPGFYTGIDPSGPRAVCLALAKAMGIEVDK